MPSGDLHSKLLDWYDANRRDLPWRQDPSPYRVWVSEIMLQQTQVATVLPYFQRWMTQFPDVEALARADEQEVLAAWQGLGYYRRAKMLHQAARELAGKPLPTNAEGWRKVSGVGRYTSGAIASIAFGEPTPLVDGNVERVYARLTGDASSGAKLSKAAWDWACQTVHPLRPGDWNQALMELGATVCLPGQKGRAPRCEECPLQELCVAKREGKTLELPTASPQKAVVRQEEHCLIARRKDEYGLEQIPAGKWWAGMWRFPTQAQPPKAEKLGSLRYTVTHHRVVLHVHEGPARSEKDLRWVRKDELEAIAMPAPYRKAARRYISSDLNLFSEPPIGPEINS
ncbi:MAG: A/G-specific adenine glycosylase [Armatimonadetes bacterium]|nr:A/G-specific adenine glycosylase [Armatimonadota bacterium]